MEGLRWKTSGFRGKRLGTFPAPWAAERHTRAADHDRCDVVRLPADECHARGASAHECYVRPALETFVRGPPAAETSHLERARAHAVQRAAGAVGPAGVAGAAAVAEQVEMKLELLSRGRDLQHRVV